MDFFDTVALIIFLIAWFGCLATWIYGVYHLFKLYVRWWKDTGKSRGYMYKFLVYFYIIFKSGLSEQAQAHRRKALKGILAFLVCWTVGFAVGILSFPIACDQGTNCIGQP